MKAREGLKEEEEGVVWMTAAAACCQRASLQFWTDTQVVSVAECLFNGGLARCDAIKTSLRLILKHSNYQICWCKYHPDGEEMSVQVMIAFLEEKEVKDCDSFLVFSQNGIVFAVF